ncbi:unnamed protein product [Cylindrotheca closterium]|uniref:Uncharacterized protein n=1 Tax=Cylindrotheca closterium TaxID=2856 RepID=A0AAD2CPW7_9STRA|nr:unnamed protein product [Cylindrotheca closterium]
MKYIGIHLSLFLGSCLVLCFITPTSDAFTSRDAAAGRTRGGGGGGALQRRTMMMSEESSFLFRTAGSRYDDSLSLYHRFGVSSSVSNIYLQAARSKENQHQQQQQQQQDDVSALPQLKNKLISTKRWILPLWNSMLRTFPSNNGRARRSKTFLAMAFFAIACSFCRVHPANADVMETATTATTRSTIESSYYIGSNSNSNSNNNNNNNNNMAFESLEPVEPIRMVQAVETSSSTTSPSTSYYYTKKNKDHTSPSVNKASVTYATLLSMGEGLNPNLEPTTEMAVLQDNDNKGIVETSSNSILSVNNGGGDKASSSSSSSSYQGKLSATGVVLLAAGVHVFRLQRKQRRLHDNFESWNASWNATTTTTPTTTSGVKANNMVLESKEPFVAAALLANKAISSNSNSNNGTMSSLRMDDTETMDKPPNTAVDSSKNSEKNSKKYYNDDEPGFGATPEPREHSNNNEEAASKAEDIVKATMKAMGKAGGESTTLEQGFIFLGTDASKTVASSPDPTVEELEQQVMTLEDYLNIKVDEELAHHLTSENNNSQEDTKYPKERMPILDPVERAKVSAKYAAIGSLEDRAFQILVDLGMIDQTN